MYESDFTDLQREGQQNLLSFLRIDRDVAGTFLDLAAATSAEHRRQLVQKVRSVIGTVRRFAPRIVNSVARREIQEEADQLEKLLGA
jgi:hypothetical protein